MSPGDKVYILDGWRICRVVLAQSGETLSVVRRRMPGHPDLVLDVSEPPKGAK